MNLINPFELPKECNLLFDKPSLGYKDEFFKIIQQDDLYIFQTVAKAQFGVGDFGDFDVTQIELPKTVISWLADSIENKMWKSAIKGGLPSGAYSIKEVISDEKFGLFREMNVGAKSQKGFLFTNYSRPSRNISFKKVQDFYLTDVMLLDGGLLDFLKS